MYKVCYIGGYIGPAGGGKSLSMAAQIVWFLLQDQKVWSNMKVKVSNNLLNRHTFQDNKIYMLETDPLDMSLLYMLDESLISGVVALDEIGYFADSRQSGSVKNRLINACIRQARHRELNILYTALDFNVVDYRLRSETDYLVTCEDMKYKGWGRDNEVDGGHAILQRYYDISGKMTGTRCHYLEGERNSYNVMLFHGTPYFNTYDTHEIISLEDAFSKVKLDLQETRLTNKGEPVYVQAEIDIRNAIAELVDNGKTILTHNEFAMVVGELGLPNNKTTKSQFYRNGVSWNNKIQAFVINGNPPVGVGVSA